MSPFLLIGIIFIVSHADSPDNNPKTVFPKEYRNYTAEGNNTYHRAWGAAGMYFRRISPADYFNGKDLPAGVARPNPLTITSKLLNQGDTSIPIEFGQSAFLWAWAQFIGNDISLIRENEPLEPFDIIVPQGCSLDSSIQTNKNIAFNRSEYINHHSGIRQQLNRVSSFIDGSMIYGADSLRANALRLHDGTGRLRTSTGNLLPFNSYSFNNVGGNGPDLFLSGDPRVNENVVLTSLHTLFVREHNFWCGIIGAIKPDFDDYQLYQHARAMVIAEIQAITFNEFLPALLGPNPLPAYTGYNPQVNPTLSNEFSTAIFYLSQSMFNKELLRLGSDLEVIPEGNLSLQNAFLNTNAIINEGNIDPILRGLAYQKAERIDIFFVDDGKNYQIINSCAAIQRGRDHGLPDYNKFRKAIGLKPVLSLSSISAEPLYRTRIANSYVSLDDMDIWPIVLAEDHIIGASVGITLYKVLKNQFQSLRDGDRFWYQSYLSPYLVNLVERRNLARIIVTNTNISANEIQKNLFYAAELEK